eukprot:69369-Rhodomonas_salina.4
MTTEAITTREKFRLPDLAGVSARRANGDSVYRAIQECSGIIINVCTDFSLQTDVTYAPGAKITNYICFPGGGCWVRWFETKEVTYYWSERLEPTKDFNTVDDIERRTDLIEYAHLLPAFFSPFFHAGLEVPSIARACGPGRM